MMEEVEGLLSAAKRKGLKISATEKGKVFGWASDDPHAVGKLFSGRPTHARN